MSNVKRLGDIATYVNGFAFKPSDWSDYGIPIIRIQDLTGNSYQQNKFNGDYDRKYEIIENDILISWSASLGVYIWKGEKALLNQHIFKVVFDKEKVNKKFFFYQVESILDKAKSETHGATMKHLTKPIFDALPFCLPSIEGQNQIAAILDKVTDLINLRKKEIEKLDLMVKSRFVEMFGIEKYEIVKASDICELITKGTTPPSNEIYNEYMTDRIPYIKVYNLSFTGDLLFNQEPQYISKTTHLEKLSRSKVYPGDVLMNIVGPPLGKFSIVTNQYPEWNVNQAVAIFRAKRNVIPQYLMFALMQPDILRPFLKQAVGIRQLNISLEQCRNLKFPLPPFSLQEHFADFVKQTEKSKLMVKKSLEKLEILKKSLMQKYFE